MFLFCEWVFKRPDSFVSNFFEWDILRFDLTEWKTNLDFMQNYKQWENKKLNYIPKLIFVYDYWRRKQTFWIIYRIVSVRWKFVWLTSWYQMFTIIGLCRHQNGSQPKIYNHQIRWVFIHDSPRVSSGNKQNAECKCSSYLLQLFSFSYHQHLSISPIYLYCVINQRMNDKHIQIHVIRWFFEFQLVFRTKSYCINIFYWFRIKTMIKIYWTKKWSRTKTKISKYHFLSRQ